MNFLRLAVISALVAFAWGASALAEPSRELKLGRYIGYVKLADRNEKIALSADTFMVQPDDPREFPRLNAIFKLSLGGYNTSEYVTEVFEDIRYDFNNGQLTLDEADNDLVITSEVQSDDGQTRILGDVWIRSAASAGAVFLEYQTDEPGGGSGPVDTSPFVPALGGQYEGRCGNSRGAMQINLARGLTSASSETPGLRGYAISGRLADRSNVCVSDEAVPGRSPWCVTRNFSSGTFNFYNGRLVLEEPGSSTECNLKQGTMSCRIRTLERIDQCEFRKTNLTIQPYSAQPRSSNVSATAEQRQPLPDPAPPEHRDLLSALSGQFFGYVHHESTGRYQVLRMNVMASRSVLNPHNENEVIITASAVNYFGREVSNDYWQHQFKKRPFYLRPGFTLENENTDAFLQIDDWRRGYLRGVWYSHAFGRVGTVQLVKSTTLPTLPATAEVVPSVAGDFRGPSLNRQGNLYWLFHTFVPTQPVARSQSFVSFQGQMQLTRGLVNRIKIANGSYDIYSGTLGWLTEEMDRPRLVSGYADGSGSLKLLWPGAPAWGVGLPTYDFLTYTRQSP